MNSPSPAPADNPDQLRFAAEPDATAQAAERTWKMLIVDDEPEVHDVTRLAMADFEFRGRPLHLLSAYSGKEACEMARDIPDIAVILLDVVMETDDAGLNVARYIRDELNNHFVRLVLRTGQPGQAPERRVITDYDINDYKYKTELTQQKLFTTVYTSISSYRDLMALECNRRGLEEVIKASSHIFELRSMDRFVRGVLEQLTALLYLDQDAMMLRTSGVAAEASENHCEIVAATGRFEDSVGKTIADPELAERIDAARREGSSVFGENYCVGYHQSEDGLEHFLYVVGEEPMSVPDRHLIDMFIRNVSIAYTNVRLFSECEERK